MRLKFKNIDTILLCHSIVAIAAAMFVGCERMGDDVVVSGEREQVECSVMLTVDQPTVITPMTKGAEAPQSTYLEPSQEQSVKNLWVLQYDTKGNFIGSATYVDETSFDLTADADCICEVKNVSLLDSNNETHSVVFIANTFDPTLFTVENRSKYSTLALLKVMNYPVSTKDDSTESYIDNYGLTTDPADGKQYIVMSHIEKSVVKSADITCHLKYNLAKINISLISDNTTYNPISIQMKAVPSVSSYLIDEGDVANGKIYPAKNIFKPTDYSAAIIDEATVGSTLDYTYYMPANMRGSASGTILPENKPLYADAYNSYIEVVAADKNDPRNKLTYSFYLGADGTNDFNIRPSYEYDYNLVIDDNLDSETISVDSRVEFSSDNVFDYTLERSSNCYILNPANSEQIYYIPIAKRINEFWGGNGYENNADNVINEGDDDYAVELGWYDFDKTKENTSSVPALASMSLSDITDIIEFDPKVAAPSGLTAMKVTLKAIKGDGKEGNVTVNITRTGADGEKRVLWSWHFWVTDYNPNSTAYYKNKYAMTVDGGEVHSYTGTYWNGVYAGHYIMDRDIGAKNNNDGTRSLLYQFGRKDPFRTYRTPGNWGYYYVERMKAVNVKDLVQNPTTFYAYDNITDYDDNVFPREAKYNNTTLVWCDPKTKIDQYKVNKKSIFDPSPLGWMVPTYVVWSDFGNLDKSLYVYEPTTDQNSGRFYHPDATAISPANEDNYIAYYPINGAILSTNGSYGYGSGYDWTSQCYSPIQCYMMLFRSQKEISPKFGFYRWNGRAVRPVTE